MQNQNLPPKSSSGCAPLAMASSGVPLQVVSIHGKDDTRHFLAQLGFVEGSEVSVVSQMAGNLIVEVKGSRLAISKPMAMRVMVC